MEAERRNNKKVCHVKEMKNVNGRKWNERRREEGSGKWMTGCEGKEEGTKVEQEGMWEPGKKARWALLGRPE